jgi:Preprotein translocase subunit SecB
VLFFQTGRLKVAAVGRSGPDPTFYGLSSALPARLQNHPHPRSHWQDAAAGRVANRVELKVIRVSELSAKCNARLVGTLEPTLDHDCAIAGREANALEIACNYRFTARVGQTQVVEAAITYLLFYQLQGTEPLADEDVAQFALSNGTLHSWPFVRELLYALTSRMGYPPYTLGVVHFRPKPAPQETPAQTVPGNQQTPGT